MVKLPETAAILKRSRRFANGKQNRGISGWYFLAGRTNLNGPIGDNSHFNLRFPVSTNRTINTLPVNDKLIVRFLNK